MREPLSRVAWLRWVAAAVVLALGLLTTEWFSKLQADRQHTRVNAQVRDQAEHFQEVVEHGTETVEYAAISLAEFVQTDKVRATSDAARHFMEGLNIPDSEIRAILLAPGGRIRSAVPRAGNRDLLDVKLQDLPEVWPEVEAVTMGAEPTLTGPVALPSGGTGFFYPVRVGAGGGTSWGTAATVMDTETFLQEAADEAFGPGTSPAVRTLAADGTPGPVFWGDAAVFEQNPILVTARPGGARWQVAVPPGPIDTVAVTDLRILGVALSVALALAVFLLVGTWQRRKELSQRLEGASSQVPGLLLQVQMTPEGRFAVPYASGKIGDDLRRLPEEPEARARALLDSLTKEDAGALRSAFLESATSGEPLRATLRSRRSGQWYLIKATPQRRRDGSVLWHGFVTDVSAEVAAEDQLRVSASLFEATHDGVAVIDDAGAIMDVNPALQKMTGFAAEELRGRPLNSLGVGLTPPEVYADIDSYLARHDFWRGDLTHRTRGGDVVRHAATITVVRDPDGEISHEVVVVTTASQARVDALTGLPNREALDERLAQIVEYSRAAGTQAALVIVGLDSFKDVNDSRGHRIGDILLQEAARRLRGAAADPDLVTRFGGDEFAVVLPHPADEERVGSLVRTILRLLAQPYGIGDRTVHITASAGIARFPQDAADSAALLRHAAQALRAAKDGGRNRYRHFTGGMEAQSQERDQLAEDMHRGFERDEFFALFQPIVDLQTGTIRKAEALLRWRHPERGLISPGAFIPVAERIHFIDRLGDFVLTEAIALLGRVLPGDPTFEVSVNMSPVEFTGGLSHHARRIEQLRQSGIPGTALVVEITEGLLLDRGVTAAEAMQMYLSAGVRFAIDDFGTGYSSLAYLQDLNLTYLKIDQSFTQNLAPRADNLALTQAIVDMAHALGLLVIAEGIETLEQWELLADAGCDFGQGFLFARPISAPDLLDHLGATRDAGSTPLGYPPG